MEERNKKDWTSVFLPKKQKAEIVAAIKRFAGAEAKLKAKQVRYKYSILLEGPPGTGKSSIAEAIATELDCSLYFFTPKVTGMDDSKFQKLLKSMSASSVLLVEDVDSLFTNHREGTSTLTFSAFINALDGICAQNGTFTVLTTNHPDRLDASLMRSCRIDRRWHIGGVYKEPVAEMIRHWIDCEDTPSEKLNKLVEAAYDVMVAQNYSMASLQAWLSNATTAGNDNIDYLLAHVSDLYNEYHHQDAHTTMTV